MKQLNNDRIKHVTKKQIKEFIRAVKSIEKTYEWRIWTTGCYIKNGQLNFYAGFHGQAIDANVLYEDYEEIYDFDIYDTSVETIYDNINDIIKESDVND